MIGFRRLLISFPLELAQLEVQALLVLVLAPALVEQEQVWLCLVGFIQLEAASSKGRR